MMVKSKKGFTLVELLVVISIIGILSSITFVGIKAARERSKVTKAKTDIGNISLSTTMLYSDTRKYPSYFTTVGPTYSVINAGIPRDTEIKVSDPSAGLITGNICTGAETSVAQSSGESIVQCFSSDWNGPYYKGPEKDPWGHDYWIDPDYYGPPFDAIRIGVFSYGKDGTAYNCDDVYKSLYRYDMSFLTQNARDSLQVYSNNANPKSCPNFKGAID